MHGKKNVIIEMRDSVYYLERAASLFDQFQDQISLEETEKMFNVLGNACRGLKIK